MDTESSWIEMERNGSMVTFGYQIAGKGVLVLVMYDFTPGPPAFVDGVKLRQVGSRRILERL